MMSSRKISRIHTNYDLVPFSAKYKEKAELSACLLSQEVLGGPLLITCTIN